MRGLAVTKDVQTSWDKMSRRDFLKTGGKGLLGAALTSSFTQWGRVAVASSPAESNDQTNPARLQAQTGYPLKDDRLPHDKRIGYALVGLGKLSQGELLPAFAQCKKSKLVALVSGDQEKAKTLAARYNVDEKNLYDYQTYDRLADNPNVDVIFIVLPNHLHAEYTIRGAKAGKHILCEKPMANSVAECDDMIRACKRADRKLMIAYRAQYEPHNRRAIQLVRSQEFGKTKHIFADNCQNQSPDETPWRLDKARSGGGALPDIGIYCLNATRYLTGEEPIEISAQMFSTPGDSRFKSVEESIQFHLRFPNGITASCLSSYGVYNSKRLQIYAENGLIDMDPAFAYRGIQLSSRSGPIQQEADKIQYQLPTSNQFAREIDHMSTCILENKTPHTPGEEGRQDMKLISLIYQSAQKGEPISLPAITKLDVFRSDFI
jgi:predicted dehydrogenase